MSSESLVPIYQAAERLGTDRRTVAGLVKALGIHVYRLPYSPKGKGLDAHALARLAIALGRSPSPPEPVSQTP